MERQLVTIRTISNIEPIPEADRIEVCTVDGWKVVAEKGLHKVGDSVLYFEIDSYLPIRPEFEFLRKSSYKKMGELEGFRLRTVKMRGQISQGLIIPFSVFGHLSSPQDDNTLTGALGVIKYERPIPPEMEGKMKGDFPSFVEKTGQERIQNLAREYEKLREKTWTATEKLDGESITFYSKDGEFGVAIRSTELLEYEGSKFWKFARDNEIEEKLNEFFELFGTNIAIQGEWYKGTVYFFNMYNIDRSTSFDIDTFIGNFDMFFPGLVTVPILEQDYDLPKSLDELIKSADGKSALPPYSNREGLVLRNYRSSFKVIGNQFLLNETE